MDECAWKRLVRRYAGDRTVCNCGHAYYTPCGEATVYGNYGRVFHKITDAPACRNGCQANQHAAKLEIATKVEAELLKDQAHAA